MMKEIKEADWKLLRELKPLTLERFCQRVLLDLERIANTEAENFHHRFCQWCQVS